MFKRASVRYGRTPEPETPYQKAAQVWDERIGSARVQARSWRFMAFGSLILSAGFAGGLVWQSAWHGRSLGGAGRQVWRGPGDRARNRRLSRSDPQIAWYLARFIQDVRAVPTDPVIVRQNWLQAYEFTTSAGAAALNEYARADDPFAKLGKQQIAVDVSSVIRASPESFRVAWTERRYQDGALADTTRWTAILTVALQPPTDADRLRKNPLGIFVNAVNWSKELGQ